MRKVHTRRPEWYTSAGGFLRSPPGNNEGMTDHDKQLKGDAERLDQLEEEIEEVRHRTPEYKAAHEPHYADSGTVGREYDDQTITPPG